MIEFDYKGYVETDKNGEILGVFYRPNAIVKLINEDTHVVSNMVIDSGADVSIIPKTEGENLGFHIEEGEKVENVNGIGGQTPVVHRTIRFKIGPEIITARIAWALTDDIPPILGRETIFDIFDIEFRQTNKKVIFKKLK